MGVSYWLMVWLARAAVCLYVGSLSIRLWSKDIVSLRRARLLWTAAWITLVVHVLAALHLVHNWSQQAAWTATVNRTAEVMGSATGLELAFNYLILLLWGVDVLDWWRGLEQYEQRGRWINWSIQLYLAFMFFNATIVFNAGVSRVLGLISIPPLLFLGWRTWSVPGRSEDETAHKNQGEQARDHRLG